MAAGGYRDDHAWLSSVEFLNYETGEWVNHFISNTSIIMGEPQCICTTVHTCTGTYYHMYNHAPTFPHLHLVLTVLEQNPVEVTFDHSFISFTTTFLFVFP